MLFDRGIVAPGVDGGYVASDSAFGGKAFPGPIRQYNPGTQPFLKVNRNGERFANESSPYNDIVYAAAHQPGRVYAQICDANILEDISASTPSAALPRPVPAARSISRARSMRLLQLVPCSSATPSRSWPTSWASPVRPRTPSLLLLTATMSCTTSRTMGTSASPLAVRGAITAPSASAGWVPLC